MSSDTSEPVLLEKPNEEEPLEARPTPLKRQSTLTPKKCWICICDTTEDDPNNPPVWRSPCACNLTAHEACLLDWIADLQHPRKEPRDDDKIRCPQCKTEIKVVRPQSYVLNALAVVNAGVKILLLPGFGFVIGGMVSAGCWLHGFQSVYMVFGQRDAVRIFENATTGQRLFYSLIPINLIAARSPFANPVLTTGTFALLSTQINPRRLELDLTLWPPLPSTVFICLPALRRFYLWTYQQLVGDFERRLDESMRPVSTQQIDTEEGALADIENQNAAAAQEAEGEVLLEVELQIGGGEDGGADQPEANAEEAGNPAPPQNNNAGAQAHVLEIVEAFGLGSKMLGALAFPAVAAGMGHLLARVLPSSWLGPANTLNNRPGLLRNQWGRSVVGGAIFIVLKDSLMLYARWKRAQAHKLRRVVDYDKKAKKYLM